MLNKNVNIDNWKKDQIKYFKEYQGCFEKDSKEYKILERGIKELENSR